MPREQSEPLQHMTQAQRQHYADRLERMADGSNGSLGQRIRDAAALARGGDGFYPQEFRL